MDEILINLERKITFDFPKMSAEDKIAYRTQVKEDLIAWAESKAPPKSYTDDYGKGWNAAIEQFKANLRGEEESPM